MVSDGDDAAVRVNGVQHCGCRPVKLTVLAVGASLVGRFGVDRHGANDRTVSVMLDDCTGQEVNHVAALGDEVDRLQLQSPGSPQRRQQFVFDKRQRLRGHQCRWPLADHITTCVTEALQKRVAGVLVTPVLTNRGREYRRLAKQPSIIPEHPRTYTEFRKSSHEKP